MDTAILELIGSKERAQTQMISIIATATASLPQDVWGDYVRSKFIAFLKAELTYIDTNF